MGIKTEKIRAKQTAERAGKYISPFCMNRGKHDKTKNSKVDY
jgi:hypothetical protein